MERILRIMKTSHIPFRLVLASLIACSMSFTAFAGEPAGSKEKKACGCPTSQECKPGTNPDCKQDCCGTKEKPKAK